MNIRILELIEGAKAARGLTVIIDVFRAMTVEAYVIQNSAAGGYQCGLCLPGCPPRHGFDGGAGRRYVSRL